MVRNSRQGAIPSELGWLIDELDDFAERLQKLEVPSGEALGATVAKLKASVASAVAPVSFYQLESPAVITADANVAATASVVVPDGYTRAVVNAIAAATLRSNDVAGGWALLMVAARITPNGGANFYNQWASVDGQKYGGASASSAATIEGLTAGSTIAIDALVSFPGTFTLSRASVAGSVLFLR